VATLTKHLQSTNEDLLQTQKVVEVLEVATAAAIGPRPRLSATSMPTAFRTGGASKALTAAPSAKTTWTGEECPRIFLFLGMDSGTVILSDFSIVNRP